MSEHFFGADPHDWHEHADPPAFEHDPVDHGDPTEHGAASHDPFDHWETGELPEHAPVDVGEPGIDDAYPPHLDVAIEPADGRAWVDPELLGADLDHEPLGGGTYAPPAELLDSLRGPDPDAAATPSWEALAGSEDPAIRALAARWAPPPTR